MPHKDPEVRRLYAAEWHRANRGRRHKDNRRRAMEIVIAAKSHPCVDCGASHPHYVMQFDHTGSDKVEAVGVLVRSKGLAAVLAEIAKCDLVCANCHAVRTWRRSVGLSISA